MCFYYFLYTYYYYIIRIHLISKKNLFDNFNFIELKNNESFKLKLKKVTNLLAKRNALPTLWPTTPRALPAW